MEESVLLGTKPLVDSIRHFIRDQNGVFSVCHLCECCIVQWRHDSCLLLLWNWFLASRLFSLHIIKRTLLGGSKIWIIMFWWQDQYLSRSLRSLVRYCSCHSNIKFISSRHRLIPSMYFIFILFLLCVSSQDCLYTQEMTSINQRKQNLCQWYIHSMVGSMHINDVLLFLSLSCLQDIP